MAPHDVPGMILHRPKLVFAVHGAFIGVASRKHKLDMCGDQLRWDYQLGSRQYRKRVHFVAPRRSDRLKIWMSTAAFLHYGTILQRRGNQGGGGGENDCGTAHMKPWTSRRERRMRRYTLRGIRAPPLLATTYHERG